MNRAGGQALAAPLCALPGVDAGGFRLAAWRRRRLDIIGVLAALVLVLGFVDPVARNAPTLRVILETVITLFALAGAALVGEQFHQTHRLRKLLLFGALVALAASEFVANCLPAALQLSSAEGLTAALPLAQLMVAAALVLIARTPSDQVVLGIRRPLLTTASVSLGLCALGGITGWLLRAQLTAGSSSESGLHRASNHPLDLAILVATAALFIWAGTEFMRRRQVEESQMFPLLGQAALLLAAARLYYLALPSSWPGEVSMREALRLLAVGFIFVAVLRRELEIRAGAARAAAVAERRRVAEDLHDGLAQDLAFIAAHWGTLTEQYGEEHPVMRAARHALAVSRQTISELSDTGSTSAREALDAIAHELGVRFGIRIVIDVASGTTVPADVRDQLARITREAIANSARHGNARHVAVTLKRSHGRLLLRVIDDGKGIREGFSSLDEGFGIRSMRERAAAFGGALSVRRRHDHGTELEVAFP